MDAPPRTPQQQQRAVTPQPYRWATPTPPQPQRPHSQQAPSSARRRASTRSTSPSPLLSRCSRSRDSPSGSDEDDDDSFGGDSEDLFEDMAGVGEQLGELRSRSRSRSRSARHDTGTGEGFAREEEPRLMAKLAAAGRGRRTSRSPHKGERLLAEEGFDESPDLTPRTATDFGESPDLTPRPAAEAAQSSRSPHKAKRRLEELESPELPCSRDGSRSRSTGAEEEESPELPRRKGGRARRSSSLSSSSSPSSSPSLPGEQGASENETPPEGDAGTKEAAPETAPASPKLVPRHIVLLIEMISLSLMVMFVDTLLVPAMPDITEDFPSQSQLVSWILTAYMLTGAVGTPIIGGLVERYPRRVLAVGPLSLYVIGLFGAALFGGPSADRKKSNILPLLLFRGCQGFGIAVFIICFNVIRKEFPSKLVPPALGLVGAMFSVGASAGLLGGSALLGFIRYDKIFWVMGPIGAALSIAFIVTLGPVPCSCASCCCCCSCCRHRVEDTPRPVQEVVVHVSDPQTPDELQREQQWKEQQQKAEQQWQQRLQRRRQQEQKEQTIRVSTSLWSVAAPLAGPLQRQENIIEV
eukprot:TRINITY_DN1274_c0_g1_i2.p1 TRINITY_DN1274_c0_g1~~TRINITY_DN1274_c0_g1_i2.p1  ORF type:complete len:582 (+),score=151.75 TRINITY_DN1274_c0_g1_i2:189-1934(+)